MLNAKLRAWFKQQERKRASRRRAYAQQQRDRRALTPPHLRPYRALFEGYDLEDCAEGDGETNTPLGAFCSRLLSDIASAPGRTAR